MITLETSKAAQFLPAGTIEAFEPQVKAAQKALEEATCAGNDYLGWLHLPSSITEEHLADLQACAQTLREHCDTILQSSNRSISMSRSALASTS